jgi:hypothetical protein
MADVDCLSRIGKAFRQERIANGSRERNVNAAHVQMPDFRSHESEFFTPKTMPLNGDLRPSRDLLQIFEWRLYFRPSLPLFSMCEC